jgi:hypothetical protein
VPILEEAGFVNRHVEGKRHVSLHLSLIGEAVNIFCFVRPVFAMMRLSCSAGSGSGLPLTVQKGTPAECGLLGEIKGLHLEESDQHK